MTTPDNRALWELEAKFRAEAYRQGVSRYVANACLNHADALRDILERPVVVGGWLPIESAPKDGQRVMLWAKEWSGAWAGNFRSGQWGIIPQDCDLVPQPTHWMPLPAAPETLESMVRGSS